MREVKKAGASSGSQAASTAVTPLATIFTPCTCQVRFCLSVQSRGQHVSKAGSGHTQKGAVCKGDLQAGVHQLKTRQSMPGNACHMSRASHSPVPDMTGPHAASDIQQCLPYLRLRHVTIQQRSGQRACWCSQGLPQCLSPVFPFHCRHRSNACSESELLDCTAGLHRAVRADVYLLLEHDAGWGAAPQHAGRAQAQALPADHHPEAACTASWLVHRPPMHVKACSDMQQALTSWSLCKCTKVWPKCDRAILSSCICMPERLAGVCPCSAECGSLCSTMAGGDRSVCVPSGCKMAAFMKSPAPIARRRGTWAASDRAPGAGGAAAAWPSLEAAGPVSEGLSAGGREGSIARV